MRKTSGVQIQMHHLCPMQDRGAGEVCIPHCLHERLVLCVDLQLEEVCSSAALETFRGVLLRSLRHASFPARVRDAAKRRPRSAKQRLPRLPQAAAEEVWRAGDPGYDVSKSLVADSGRGLQGRFAAFSF